MIDLLSNHFCYLSAMQSIVEYLSLSNIIISLAMNTEVKRNSEILEALFTYRKVDELEEYLADHPDLNINRLVDSQGNNVLHQLAYEGHLELIKVLVRKAVLKLRKSCSNPSSK